jgi:hypothetical protein
MPTEVLDSRIKHRRVELRPVGADGSAAVLKTEFTGPALIRGLAVDYISQPATTDLLIKADNLNGATIFTRANSATDIGMSPVGTTAVDEARGATAATDGFSGGFPVRGGIYFDVAQGDGQTTGDEAIIVDVWYERVNYIRRVLRPIGADGSAVVTDTVRLNKAGNLIALALDFQNQPATVDVVVKADSTSGTTLFTSTSSLTDLAPSMLGRPGIDEAAAATAATDGTASGNFFKTGLFIDVAQGDGQTSGDELIVVEFWIE